MTQSFASTEFATLQDVRGGDSVLLDPFKVNSVGRADHCDLCLTKLEASRTHALIYWDGRKWFVVDCSSNGTYVNNKRMQRHALSEGDTIRFCEESEWIFSETVPASVSIDPSTVETARFKRSPLRETGEEWLILGSSASTSALRNQVSKIADQHGTLLIRGEIGVGKRHAARAIHMAGARRSLPFLSVDCKQIGPPEILTLPRTLQERSQGGGDPDTGGTVLLDEVCLLSGESQRALLELLAEQSIRLRLGEVSDSTLRFMAVSTADPGQQIESGSFDWDLWTRLSVVQILIDPLRDRPQDIPELAAYFARQCANYLHRPSPTLTQQSVDTLLEYDWPGNVLELRNVVERAVMLSETGDLTPSLQVGANGDPLDSPAIFQGMSLEQVERHHIESTLRGMGWKKSHVAEVLGIERSTLDRKIKRYQLRRGDG